MTSSLVRGVEGRFLGQPLVSDRFIIHFHGHPAPTSTVTYVYRHIGRGRSCTNGGLTGFASSEISDVLESEAYLLILFTHIELTPRHCRENWLACTSKIHLCVSDKLHTLSNKGIAKTDLQKMWALFFDASDENQCILAFNQVCTSCILVTSCHKSI